MFQAITNKIKTVAFAIGFITTLALPGAAQDFRVEGAGLEAAPISYRGPCPGLIKFQGKIQANLPLFVCDKLTDTTRLVSTSNGLVFGSVLF